MSKVTQDSSNVKKSAIFARTSTKGQFETSIPTQIDRCRKKLEAAGFSVNHVLQRHWTSLDLYSCPEFQDLRALIRARDIEAVAVLDRDRLEAKGLQRLVFLSECQESGVELVICQGPPIVEGPEGQLVELALAIGKERSVLRTRQGSKDGLHDRAVLRRLPTSRHKLYGYRWQDERTLAPNEDWPALKLIFDLALSGVSYFPIIQELKKRGILSPSGKPEWAKAVISAILHNPTYAGRYYALKKRAVEPRKRNGITYGNSSCVKLPLDQSFFIPEIKVIDPPITWEQREQILRQLEAHQRLASRNANREYLLRGFIECPEHMGVQGKPRIYHGQPHPPDSWRYVCPVGGCAKPYLNGPELERLVKFHVGTLLFIDEALFDDFRKTINSESQRKSIAHELARISKKREANISKEVKLEGRLLAGLVSEEAATILKEQIQNERHWLAQEEDSKLAELAQVGQQRDVVSRLAQLRLEFGMKAMQDELIADQWRHLFMTLHLKIRPRTTEEKRQFYEADAAAHELATDAYNIEDVMARDAKRRWLSLADIDIQIAIPLPETTQQIGDIVSYKPEPD